MEYDKSDEFQLLVITHLEDIIDELAELRDAVDRIELTTNPSPLEEALDYYG